MPTPLSTAIAAARAAGELLRANFGQELDVTAFKAHDIKLDLDVRSQDLITARIFADFPNHALYGEEGVAGNQDSEYQWIVDPIDGTVNYFYSIPHFCISIALRHRMEMQLGVIYDPMRDELWEVEAGGVPLLNGKPCKVSPRTSLPEAIVSVGLSKDLAGISAAAPRIIQYAQRVRKCRVMGSAALDLAYVACGRLDAYIEQSVSLWDVAAGKILVEQAGGKFEMRSHDNHPDKVAVQASNGRFSLELD